MKTGKQQYVRDEIESAIKKLCLSESCCKEVGKNQWKAILDRIEEEFINYRAHRSRWNSGIEKEYWEYLKRESYSVYFEFDDANECLSDFIDNDEKVWLLAREKSYSKLWIYEGCIQPIQEILSECFYFEYYIVSKKFLWLLCENEHGYLIGSGESMIAKMKKYAGTL